MSLQINELYIRISHTMLLQITAKRFTSLFMLLSLISYPALVYTSPDQSKTNIAEGSEADHRRINPHFSGKDCNLCHIETPEPGDKDIRLKFGEDDVTLCDECHQSEHAKGDLHPVNIAPREGVAISIPDDFPLYDLKITCRTCHDVYAQCQVRPAVRFENINFLWGAPYQKITDMCFRCHDIKAYKKTNPLEQIDDEGNILTVQCLYCHQSLPDPDSVSSMEEVTFKTDTSTFCAACHGEEEEYHPAKVSHMVVPDQEILSTLKEAEKEHEVILPLFQGKQFCGTCHNPHDRGVIKRKEAAKGMDTEHRLRLDGSYTLCVSCHEMKKDMFSKDLDIDIEDTNLNDANGGGDIPSYHKSFIEKKCRACHTVTRESPQLPVVYKMCFQVDCHDASLIEETFQHSEALQGDCLLCHNQHGSQYGAHIVNDQQKLCRACHPLLRGVELSKEEREVSGEDFHDHYTILFRKLVPDQKDNCAYCHGQDHSERIHGKGIVSCYQCHNYIKELIKGKKGKPKNIHETFVWFVREKCTLCHNPHSSPYPHLLKKEPESYQ